MPAEGQAKAYVMVMVELRIWQVEDEVDEGFAEVMLMLEAALMMESMGLYMLRTLWTISLLFSLRRS